MSGFYPVPSTRSTNLLMQTRVVEQLNFDSLALQRLQTQISTGLKISTPGEDPAIADRAITLQRLIELKNQTKTNIQASQSYLDASDTALSNVSKLLNDVRSAVVAANSDTSTDAMRQAAAEQVDQAITQLLNTGNTNFRGRYIFAGSRSTAAPFSQTANGVVYTGNEGVLRSFVDLNLPYATNANGQEVFGTFSPQVQGTVDLNPTLTANTPISSLNGANGVTLGSSRISDGATTKTIDLSSAATVRDSAEL